jgi:hypothetical protein
MGDLQQPIILPRWLTLLPRATTLRSPLRCHEALSKDLHATRLLKRFGNPSFYLAG